VLIGRFGARKIDQHLPGLIEATRRAGSNAIWSIDPMHGNTQTIGGVKTRLLDDIVAEVRSFFDIAAAAGVHAGGVHLEMTGSDVTECIGGSRSLAHEDLGRNYLTHCDPRLNEGQALDLARAIAELLARGVTGRAEAA
jgi:3-deoxy-7-phosphoheptulonate synthase